MKDPTNAHETWSWHTLATWFLPRIVVPAAIVLMLVTYVILHGPAH